MNSSGSKQDGDHLILTTTKLSTKYECVSTIGDGKKNIDVRENKRIRHDIVLRAGLNEPQPALKLAHYRKPNFVPTQQGLHPQNLKAHKELTGDRVVSAYTDSESDAAPALALDIHRIFDFRPKTPQEADIQQRINSVPSLKQLNELRKYKLGIHPDRKFRLMLSTTPNSSDSTTQFVKDYIIETDKEKRSHHHLINDMKLNPNNPVLQQTVASPIGRKSGSSGLGDSGNATNSHDSYAVVRPNPKYDNNVRLVPMSSGNEANGLLDTHSLASIASLNSISTNRSSSPIYSPATFRVPKAAENHPHDVSSTSKDIGAASYLVLSSTDEIPPTIASSQLTTGGQVRKTMNFEEVNETQHAMLDSDSFQDSRKEQFLRDSLAEDGSFGSVQQKIRITDVPGRSRTPKKYNHYIEELDAPQSNIRTLSRQERIRAKSPNGKLYSDNDASYEALRRSGTAPGNKLKCCNCYVQAVLWCTSCVQAYCLACWNSVPHHTLYNMVPAFPNKLSKRYKQNFQNVLAETQPKYLDPAPVVRTGKREFERPQPKMVPTLRLNSGQQRPRSNNGTNRPNSAPQQNTTPIDNDTGLANMQWSPPQSPQQNYNSAMENDKSFSPKVMFSSKKASRTAAAAKEIENELRRVSDTCKVFDGNALPAKIPVINQPTVTYQDYTVPGVLLTSTGEILEMTDEFSDSAASSPLFRSARGSRPNTGKLRQPIHRTGSPKGANHSDAHEVNFEGEVMNTIHYVLPSKTTHMAPLGITHSKSSDVPVVPSGFDNSSPHKQLIRKITREGARNLQKKGDTRSFAPSFSLGGGSSGLAGSSSSSNIATSINHPSTVARPLTGITKNLVFPLSSEKPSTPTTDTETHWKDGKFTVPTGDKKTVQPKKTIAPPKITIYNGVPVFINEKPSANESNDLLKKFPLERNVPKTVHHLEQKIK